MPDRHAKLLALRTELNERLARYQDHQHRTNEPLSKQFDEQSLTIQTDEVVESLLETTRQELAAVNHAIARIEQGEGDACESCGDTIAPQRLETIPYATRCIKCAD